MNSKKILLLGGSGFLGSRLKKWFPSNFIFSPTHTELDLLQIRDVHKFIERLQPDGIIYSAGITRIDVAEMNSRLTYLLNYQTPKNISKFVSRKKIPFVYISTDAVFDGYRNKYIFSETDIPKAKSIYGLSKLKGEEAVLEISPNNAIARLITLYGIHPTKQSFVMRMLENLKKNQSFAGVIDQIQNPLQVDIAGKAIAFIVKHKLKGIYHLGALDSDSNYNFLLRIASKFNLNTSLVKKVTFADFMKNKKGHRKKKSILLCEKFATISQNKILEDLDASIQKLFETRK